MKKPWEGNCQIKGTSFTCNHCPTKGGPYGDDVVTRRMASNHIVKYHPDIAKPSSQQGVSESKRPYTPRKQKAGIGVNYCPGCGCNLNAVRVALSL